MKAMPKALIVFAVVLGPMCFFSAFEAAGQVQVPVCSTFDADMDGWGFSPAAEFTWESTDGNPGGYVRFEDSTGDTGFGYAPEKFLGDWSDLNGAGYISFDHQIFQTGHLGNGGIARYEINIRSGSENVGMWQGRVPDSIGSWKRKVAPLIESRWSVTKGSWTALLADVTEVKIRVEMVDNDNSPDRDIVGIDNVCLDQGTRSQIVCVCPPEAEPSPAEGDPVIVSIWGIGFGVTPTAKSEVRIASRTVEVVSWSDKTIEIKLPEGQCAWFETSASIDAKVTVITDGMPSSNRKRLTVLKPGWCP